MLNAVDVLERAISFAVEHWVFVVVAVAAVVVSRHPEPQRRRRISSADEILRFAQDDVRIPFTRCCASSSENRSGKTRATSSNSGSSRRQRSTLSIVGGMNSR